MTKPVTIANTFATQTGNVPASELDQNFAALATVQNDLGSYGNLGTDTGTANNYVVGFPAGITFTLQGGVPISFVPLNNNAAGPCTINVEGTGALPLVRLDGSNPLAADISTLQLAIATYNPAAGNWFLPTLPSVWFPPAQSIHNFSLSGRSLNTSYSNATKQTMYVMAAVTATTSTPTAILFNVAGNIQEGTVVGGANFISQATFAVPPNTSYVVGGTGGPVTLSSWFEVY